MSIQYERPGCCRRCLLSLRGGVVRCLEAFFFRYGKFVARRPGLVILLATAVALGCGAGCKYLRQENEGIKVRAVLCARAVPFARDAEIQLKPDIN